MTEARTITFHLREGVKFHDGTDFDAEAVKWNLEMQKNGVKTELKAVTSIEVIDRYTVRVRTLAETTLCSCRDCRPPWRAE